MMRPTIGPRQAAALLIVRSFMLLSFCVVLSGCVHMAAATQPGPLVQVSQASPQAAPQTGREYDLAACLALGLQNHPRISAQRASLAGAQTGQQALETLRAPTVFVPDLPIRQRQAALGVTAAAAALEQAERETAYGVTRTYLSVLYARDQERVASAVVGRLTAIRDAAQKALDAGAREASATDVSRSTVYLRLAETRQVQASQGVKRALVEFPL